MEFCLDQTFEPAFPAEDRIALIRFCLTKGTRAKCSAGCLLRPLRFSDLKKAFEERESAHRNEIAYFQRLAEEYSASSRLPSAVRSYFGGEPSKAELKRYCRRIIRQEREAIVRLKKSYTVQVDHADLSQSDLLFHRSLSPRVTFGYSDHLHEECDFLLTEELRSRFLSALQESPEENGWGYVRFSPALRYEGLCIYRGEEGMLETISHEKMFTVRLSAQDLEELALYGTPSLADRLDTVKKESE